MAHMRHSVTQIISTHSHYQPAHSLASVPARLSMVPLSVISVGISCVLPACEKITKQEANNIHCTILSIVNATVYHCSNNPIERHADVSVLKGMLVKKKLSTHCCVDKNEHLPNVT